MDVQGPVTLLLRVMTPKHVIQKCTQHQQDHQGKTDAEEADEGVEGVAEENLPGDFYVIA